MNVRRIGLLCLVVLSILSAWLLLELMFADPGCVQCSVVLVRWLLPRAELLTIGWIALGAGYAWILRRDAMHLGNLLYRRLKDRVLAARKPDHAAGPGKGDSRE